MDKFVDGQLVSEGAQLFKKGTFGGNGRTCASCHPSNDNGTSGTLSPADVEALFQSDPNHPLFRHDGADEIGGDTFNRIREHATILVEKALPPNVRLVGSDARTVTLARAIPTTMNTPALDPVLMLDGREPNLQSQALGAIMGHAQTDDVTDGELDAIAEFQQTLFNRKNLEDFFKKGKPLTMPYGNTESEKRGRRFFIADDQDDPEMVGEGPHPCGWCHSGNMLNGTSGFFSDLAPFPLPEGFRFSNVLVSEFNTIGNPVHEFEFTMPDGSVTTVNSPDPGLALVTGNPGHANMFKSTTVWGVSDTAPYFHDNSAKDLDELMDHYDTVLFLLSQQLGAPQPVDLTEQQKDDVAAYMRLL